MRRSVRTIGNKEAACYSPRHEYAGVLGEVGRINGVFDEESIVSCSRGFSDERQLKCDELDCTRLVEILVEASGSEGDCAR